MSAAFFRPDDVFLLGNLALTALGRGRGKHVLEMARLVQALRPYNTTGFMIEALYLHSTGDNDQALEVMERSQFAQATLCADEGCALHFYLLAELGLYEQVLNLGEIYLKERKMSSESARDTIETVLQNTRDALPARHTLVSL